MYYILNQEIENDKKDAILNGDSKYLNRIECSFRQGLPLPSEDIDVPISFKINKNALRGTMTDHLSINDIPGPVFSLKTKTLLEESGITNIEYYQLKLIDEFPNGDQPYLVKPRPEVYHNYFIANVVGLVDCVDHEKSVLEYFYPPELRNPGADTLLSQDDENNPFAGENPNDIDFVTSLVIDETRIDPSLKVFRLSDKPDLLVFHESIVKAIKKARLSGFVFVPLAEYTDVIPDDENMGENKEKKEKTVKKENPEQKVTVVAPDPAKQPAPSSQPNKRKFSFIAD